MTFSLKLTFLKIIGRGDTDESKDSTPESQVEDECDHDLEKTVIETDRLALKAATYEKGHLVVPFINEVEWHCEKCDEQVTGPFGDPHVSRRLGRKAAIPVAFVLDEDVTISEALVEPVRDEADYAVDRDGEVERLENNDEGRILVNRSENPAEDKAAQAGGPTD